MESLEAIPWNVIEDTTYWWEGIVAPRETWSTNSQEEGIRSSDELENWGKRVKVRIQGVHPASKIVLPDSQLPWAEVRLGTSGSGHKGAGISICITQGSRVCGIWEDPEKKEGPIITSILGNNANTHLSKTQGDDDGFKPYSGYTYSDLVPTDGIPCDGTKPLEGAHNPNLWSVSDSYMMQEFAFGIVSPSDCEKIPLGALQKSMQALIQSIEKAKNQLNSWENAAQGWIDKKQEWIQKKIEEATEFISSGLKWVFKEIRKWTEEQINNAAKAIFESINPPDRDKAKLGQDALLELISCIFNKLIGNLKTLIGNFLGTMLDRYINVPACAIENFVGSIIGNTLGALSGTVDSAISSVSGLLGSAFSLADSILGLIQSIAGFFACDEKQECPEVKEWSIFDGGKPPATFDIDSILNGAKEVANNAKGIVDSTSDIITSAAAAVDFNDLFNTAVNATNSCNIGPLFCGPPTATFWGGGGSGAKGNAIVSAAGDILGVDIVASGTGYTKAPFLSIEDSCGKGSGANAIVVMGKESGSGGTGGTGTDGTGGTGTGTDGTGTDGTGGTGTGTGGTGGTDTIASSAANPNTGPSNDTFKVIAVIIENPGDGYISRPDGDIGGDGRVWAPYPNTVVRTEDGLWKQYLPGEPISSGDSDLVIRPEEKLVIDGGSFIPKPDEKSDIRGISRIPGTNPDGSTNFNSFPSINVGSYPTILYLCNLYIKNKGINYSQGDKLVIEPSFGAEVDLMFDAFGSVLGFDIINPGNGFTEYPLVYIKSETGYNSVIYPQFCVYNLGDDSTPGDSDLDDRKYVKVIKNITKTIDIRDKIVTVVDCVGKFN